MSIITLHGTKVEYYFYGFVNTLLCVAKDPRLAEIEQLAKSYPKQISIREVADEVGMSHTGINHWIKTAEPKPRDSDKIDAVLRIMREKAANLTNSPARNRIRESVVTYNPALPQAEIERIAQLATVIEITATVVPASGLLESGKTEKRVKIGSAYPGALGRPIQIDGPLGNIKSGSILIFQETDYPSESIYLLFQNKKDENVSQIGWIDPQKGSKIQTPDGRVLNHEDWKVTHFATAAMWGAGDHLDYTFTSKPGISIHSRF